MLATPTKDEAGVLRLLVSRMLYYTVRIICTEPLECEMLLYVNNISMGSLLLLFVIISIYLGCLLQCACCLKKMFLTFHFYYMILEHLD